MKKSKTFKYVFLGQFFLLFQQPRILIWFVRQGSPPPFHLHWFYFIFEGVQEKHLQFARKKNSIFTEKKPAYDYDVINNYSQNNCFEFGKYM